MDSTHDANLIEAVNAIRAKGITPIPVVTSDPQLPWVVFQSLTLSTLDAYTSQARNSPLMAAINLFNSSAIGFPQGTDVTGLVSGAPFLVLRAVQALLCHYGLGATAQEKKSLS